MSTTIPLSENAAATNGHAGGPTSSALERTLSDWRRGRLWHDSAPAALRKNWAAGDQRDTWQKWASYLASRKPPVCLDEACAGKAPPLDWGLPAGEALIGGDLSCEKLAPDVENWLSGARFDWRDARRAVVAAYQLPALTSTLDTADWWRLTTALASLAEQQQLKIDEEDRSGEELLLVTLAGGELPLVLGTLLPELKPLRSLRNLARKTLGEGLLSATDGEGLIDGVLLPWLPPLFASWTRCRAIGEGLKKNCWSNAAETQYEWLVRQTIRLTRPSGKPMLASREFLHWPAGAIDTALDLVGDEGDEAAASAHLPKVLPTVDGDYDEDDLPEESVESEWSSLALLADGWGKRANRVLVDYSSPDLRIEIESQGRTLVSGTWTAESEFAGRRLEPTGGWEQQCWFSDEDCDFLDLVIELSGGARLERQIFLGKEDAFLLLHDLLHAQEGQPSNVDKDQWRHAFELPLGDSLAFVGEAETRDGLLVDAKGTVRAGVLPLALAEWRVESRHGELTSSDGLLKLAQHARGRRLSCPLWLDLRARRAAKQRTWRQLTVAESLEVVPRDVAVGYRVQSGDSQWLLYRSLTAPANRTLLGQNTSAEMLIGRFLRTGELDELLEVDPA